MIQKIYARRVMRMGHEPEHSLMVTIPKKICDILQIEKGTKLYFKLEENRFVVSKDSKFLDDDTNNSNYTTIESIKSKEKAKGDVIVQGASLADLQY
ncbi:MAG: AbrB/MazE/SpoVT family DNA-binding domain-containing protein [Nitrosotalea sp.]